MVGVVLVGPFADFTPQVEDFFLVFVVLYQAVGHVHAEAVHAFSVPEGDDVFQFLTYGFRAWCVYALFPRMIRVRVRVAVVQ